MTAREKIAFDLGLLGIADDQIEASLDAFAHELAEQQRTEMRAPGRSYDAARWNRCVDHVADHIDPEVAT